ncbi:family 43 glycosylhydrolase [Actinomadura kijaniata]|uniref:family 43 glycosylhydrolase n=1 Tax=Actinomadura kijaniata TaxID=46161 RepID=UPI003F19AA7D
MPGSRHARTAFSLALSCALAVAFSPSVPAVARAPSPAVHYTNPIAPQRADAHIVKHADGNYYFTATVPEYDRVVIRRSPTLQGLSTAQEKVVWTKHATGEMGAHIWAPEIHFIDGRWYVYFAAGSTDDIWRIRMYVLESSGPDPFSSTWTEKGRIRTPHDSFSLDATTFTHGGKRYLAWAQKPPGSDVNSGIHLARLRNPWTIEGDPVLLTTPTHDWETRGFKVNEGPAFLVRGSRMFLTFSASATDAHYCLGLLTAPATADPLDPAAWRKTPVPVFTSDDATRQYGPGHNSFTVSEDGRSDVLVYHDRWYRDIQGDPLNDPNRRTRVQKLYWNADGTPNFGVPVPDGPTPYRLAAVSRPGHVVRHRDGRAVLERDVTALATSQFRVVPGLAGPGGVSLESIDRPGHYLRHRGFEVRLDRDDGSAPFRADASFHRRPGLASASAVSFESVNFPGRYLRHRDLALRLDPADFAQARADATFDLQ